MRRRPRRALTLLIMALFTASLAAPTSFAATRSKETKQDSRKTKKKKEADAKDARAWTFGREAGFPLLAYNTPSGTTLISFVCQPDAGQMRVIVFGGAKGVKAGDSARVRLRNGTTRVEVAGTGIPGEAKGSVDIAGVTRITSRTFTLFRGGEILMLEVPSRNINVPLKNLGNKGEGFERACGSRR